MKSPVPFCAGLFLLLVPAATVGALELDPAVISSFLTQPYPLHQNRGRVDDSSKLLPRRVKAKIGMTAASSSAATNKARGSSSRAEAQRRKLKGSGGKGTMMKKCSPGSSSKAPTVSMAPSASKAPTSSMKGKGVMMQMIRNLKMKKGSKTCSPTVAPSTEAPVE
jgi:hypothetical protein